MSDTKISEAAVAWRQRHPKEGGGLSEWIYTAREPKKYVGSEYEALYLHPQPAELAEQQGVEGTGHSTEDNYQHFLSYSGLDGDDLLRYAYYHGADVGLERPALAATGKRQVGEVQGDARAQFEAWQETFYTYPLDTTRHSDGHYQNPVTQGAFAIWKAALAARQPVAAIPAGFALVPEKFGIPADVWEGVEFVIGGPGTAEDEAYLDSTAWIGDLMQGDGSSIYGLHLSCDECPEEGSVTLAEFAAPPAQGIDLGHGKFRDPDHLAEWLGSLVDGNEQEEWDAAQAAMQGVRAYQRDADTVLRLQAAVEGECEGLAITPEQAVAILDYVLQPLNYEDSQRDSAPGVGNG